MKKLILKKFLNNFSDDILKAMFYENPKIENSQLPLCKYISYYDYWALVDWLEGDGKTIEEKIINWEDDPGKAKIITKEYHKIENIFIDSFNDIYHKYKGELIGLQAPFHEYDEDDPNYETKDFDDDLVIFNNHDIYKNIVYDNIAEKVPSKTSLGFVNQNVLIEPMHDFRYLILYFKDSEDAANEIMKVFTDNGLHIIDD